MTTTEQVAALRKVLADDFGITDIPTYDPILNQGAPRFEIGARSPLTRRQMLDALPEARRTRRLAELAAFSIDTDLDSPEIICVTVYGYADRKIERAEGQSVGAPRSYAKWLSEQVEAHFPGGYMPVGSWARLRPVAAVQAAKAALDAAPETLSAAVRSALEAGVSGPKLAEALGVTRARVYQLRDGRR
jgi:hypothetical protein